MPIKNIGVLIITQYFHPEEFGINDLALEWKDKGYSVYVLTQSPNYPYDKIYDGYKNHLFQKTIWNNIVIYRVYSLLGYQKNVLRKILHYLVFALLSSIASLFIFRKISKVFVYQVGPLTQIIPGMLLKKIFRKSLFLWVLDLWPDTVFAYGIKRKRWSESIMRYFVKTSYNLCDHIFVSNNGFKNTIKQYSPKVEITFSPQWVPKDLIFKDSKPKEDLNGYFNFTFAGNIGKVQNLENIIKGFGQAKKNNNVRLNIIGDGSNLKTLKELVIQEDIDNVIFWGRQPLTEMPMWFLGSDVLIISLIDQPNFALTVPAKFQAYLAAEKPIFSCINGETNQIVKDNKLGLTSKPDNIEEIKKVFECFSAMTKDEIDSFPKNAKHILENYYEYNTVVKQITELVFADNESSIQ